VVGIVTMVNEKDELYFRGLFILSALSWICCVTKLIFSARFVIFFLLAVLDIRFV
jgi:lipid-A-disaccharide synthase-like uncharacterized protein